MTIDEKIEVLQAFKDGKEIECTIKTDEINWITLTTEPVWNFHVYKYRIKEETKELLWFWSVQQPDGDWEIEQYMETETRIKQMYKNYTRLDTLGSKEQE